MAQQFNRLVYEHMPHPFRRWFLENTRKALGGPPIKNQDWKSDVLPRMETLARFHDMRGQLVHAFDWHDTPQGYEFWLKVAKVVEHMDTELDKIEIMWGEVAE